MIQTPYILLLIGMLLTAAGAGKVKGSAVTNRLEAAELAGTLADTTVFQALDLGKG